MTTEWEQLVRETVEMTGSAPPQLFDEQAPVLTQNALSASDFYLVGMIGGKDVGKSALVNALTGQSITPSTSFGPGTETVIAYAHESQQNALRRLLDSEMPGQYRLVTHSIAQLSRQVLLDLPDIDSHWLTHVEITRKMLRHLLFPLWVQSVEKYADLQPQNLLSKVAQGNDATNFIFCLNKADQVSPAAIEELREDYSRRIGRTLKIDPPKVWMLSAVAAEKFDLPELQKLLSNQKPVDGVRQSQSLAVRQQNRSLGAWLDSQDLPGRADRLGRMLRDAEELLSERVGVPLLERSLPGMADDPASRMALTDEVLSARCGRWPIVNLVHVLLTPVLAVVRRNVGATRSILLPDAEALVDAHLQSGGSSLATVVRGTFAQLQQTQPQVSELYRNRKLWEDMTAESAVVHLRATLADTITRQRDAIRQRLVGKAWVITAPLRWILTIGAVLWFPFIQPICQTLLTKDLTHSTHDIVLLTVNIFSVNQLLQNLTFLAMYFFLLWIILRWDTQRRIERLARRWKAYGSEMSLQGVAVQWMDDLLEPIRSSHEKARSLAERAKNMNHRDTEAQRENA
jgi:GTPase Era involved in 16S rRNA processing